ncbi:MAG: hypothetical protein E6767_16965 [Dysgonomonas sp.]|nr:hypothetical protein [Dysgonomonas sp.]
MKFEGIDKNKAHPRSIELMTDDFLWSASDELSPFGSDEGHTALCEFRRWRKKNKKISVGYCIAWVIESVGEFTDYEEYDEENLVNEDKVNEQINNPDFDDHQYIFTLDTSVIATALGQLVDEGLIEVEYKYYVQVAINRLRIWASLHKEWKYKDEYIRRLNIIEKILEKA